MTVDRAIAADQLPRRHRQRVAGSPDDDQLPAGAKPFDSGKVPAGNTYRQTFATPGTYRYFCKPHETKGMVGEIVVQP